MLVFLETGVNGLKRSSYEAITAARKVAGGKKVCGVVFNASAEHIAAAGAYGLESCINVIGSGVTEYANGVWARTIADAAKQCGAQMVLFSANAHGKDLAPRVAVLLEAGLLVDCVELDGAPGNIEAVRPIFGGRVLQKVQSTTPVTVVTVRPNVFTARTIENATQPQESQISISDSAQVRSAVVKETIVNQGRLDVSEADIVVSGGRGLKAPEHFELIENLARVLGGAVGASRAVVDAGWRPHSEQVGQTGKTVSPTMYVACGISGAVQHLAGMSSSKIIVAVNKDKDAPIFKMADYGIVGDVFDVLPKLTSGIATITHKN